MKKKKEKAVLFDNDPHDVPTQEEIGEACMRAAGFAFGNRYKGKKPKGIDREEIISELAVRAQKKSRDFKFQRHADGSVKLRLYNFCYLNACHALADVMNEKSARRLWHKEAGTTAEGKLFDACVNYALAPTEFTMRPVFLALLAIAKARNVDAFESDIISLEDIPGML